MHCTDTKTTEQRQPITSGGEAAFVVYRKPVALMAYLLPSRSSSVCAVLAFWSVESSDHRSERADTSCQIRLQLRSSVFGTHEQFRIRKKQTVGRAVALSSPISCRIGRVIAPLHSLTSSVVILINRVAPPNMLPIHLATTLSDAISIFLQLSLGKCWNPLYRRTVSVLARRNLCQSSLPTTSAWVTPLTSSTTQEKTTRLKWSRVHTATLPDSRGTSLTDCRTQDPPEPRKFARADMISTQYQTVFRICSFWDCCGAVIVRFTLGSLRGGVSKIVNQITPAPLFEKKKSQVAKRHGWTHWRYWLHKVAGTENYTDHTQEFLDIDHAASAHLKQYPLNRFIESDNGPSQHRLLASAFCSKPALL